MPQNLSHFAPKQEINKDEQEPDLQVQPSVEPTEEPSCGVCGTEEATISSGEPAIREFLGFIDRGESESAISMMTDYIIPDSPSSNAWHDNLNSIESMAVVSIEPDKEDNWTEEKESYKVVLDVKTKSGEIVYGWMPGGNTRLMEVVRDLETNTWMINFITSMQ